jgi:hypothetical protein
VEKDPPYFVYIYRMPGPSAAVDPDLFESRIVGGKQVYVGTEDMLEQSEHQKGRPYWYEMDAQTLVIVITDKETWAIDALSQLP